MEDAKVQKSQIDALFCGTRVMKLCYPILKFNIDFIC